MNIRQLLRFAGTGWLAGALATAGVGWLWPQIFPGIVRVEHYYGAGPSLTAIVLLMLGPATPAGIVGGLVGSRLPREGGEREQILAAAIGGILLAVPLGCWGYWFWTGW